MIRLNTLIGTFLSTTALTVAPQGTAHSELEARALDSGVAEAAGAVLPWAVPVGVAVFTIVVGMLLQGVASRRKAGQRVPAQLAVLALWNAGLLVTVLVLPIEEAMRGQLLSYLGIVASAAIALASTTLLGNLLAGIMLRLVREFRVGDFVRVEGIFGRVTERGIIHTEIQTEDRDLTTLPNLYIVSHPLTIVRASGTILSTRVSLGYDVSRHEIEAALLRAAQAVGLQHPFVEILELGDFSVLYRIAGLLEDLTALVSSRSKLNAAVLDELHAAQIEIMSPTMMTTRNADGEVFMPREASARTVPLATPQEDSPESVIFDKAEDLSALAELEKQLVIEKERLAALDANDTGGRHEVERSVQRIEREAEERKARLDQGD